MDLVAAFFNACKNRFQRFQIMRLNKQICIGFFIALPLCAGLATPASAQLRTGREQRTLYHDQLVSEQKQQQQSKAQSGGQSGARSKTPSARPGGVAQASYSEDAGPAKSILEEKLTAPVGSAVNSAVKQNTVQRPAEQNSTHHDGVVHDSGMSDGYYEPTPSRGSMSGGCNCGACSSGCDDFAELAPTCASMCGSSGCGEAMFTGCGPLASLLSNLSIRAEVPLYWRRAAGPPALVTTSPTGTAQGTAGELGQTTTQILFGNGPLNDDANAGFRITLGTSFGGSDNYGLLFRYWNAGSQDDTATFRSTQNAILARPFLNTTNGAGVQDTQLIAFPTQSTGNISISTTSDVSGLNVMLRRLAYRDRYTRVDWLYGYQHVNIEESLSINTNTLVTGNVNPALNGASIAVSDRFATQNDFNGVTYGFMGDRRMGCWKMESMFRLGLGNLRRQVNVGGSTTTTSSAGVSATDPQGLLARNTNGQPFKDDTFVVVPEVGFNVAYNIRPGLDFNVGYNYMLIPKVAQASRQIDKQLAVNLSEPLTGGLDPQLDFEERKYWLHSLGLGLQWNY